MNVVDEGWNLESWGWTDLSSYWSADLDVDKEQYVTTSLTSESDACTMSRRSLRIHYTTGTYGEDLQDSAPKSGSHGSSSVGGEGPVAEMPSSQAIKNRRSQSLLQTPKKSVQVHNSSLHSCAASDASLLSSMLDESCIQERTLVENFWGLDEEAELQDQTKVLRANGETSAQTQTSMVNGYFSKDRSVLTDRQEAFTAYPSSSKYITSSTASLTRPAIGEHALTTDPASSTLSPPPIIYSRDKSRKTKTDAHSSSCGRMNVKELEAERGDLNRNASLWKSVKGVFWWLGAGWYHLITLTSLLNVFVLIRCLPRLLKLLLLLFFLLLGVWCWGPSDLLSGLPAFNMTEWVSASLSFPREGHTHRAALFPVPPSEPHQDEGSVSSLQSERLARLEESLSKLWEHVEGGDQRLEQQHREVMGQYQTLQEQLPSQAERGSLEPWMSSLLEDRLDRLKAEMLEEETAQRRQQHVEQQELQDSRLDQMERLLQAVTLKTEEVQKRQENMTPAPVSTPSPPPVPEIVGVDRDSHDALLAEVQRLELVLVSIREDLQGVMGCQGRCGQLDSLQDTVSGQVSQQVRQELRSLFYGIQKNLPEGSEPGSGETELPESLLLWLSERYVSGADLQASLASLEQRILQNVSVQLQQDRSTEQGPSTQGLTQTVLQTVGAAGATGVTEEDVQLIVRNALKLYSEDRTGLVDYALESGGGSIMSTRCSETYKSKTALMSLFGLPLWYFSQSPRVVIQPDVNPGNCWAFQGSSGYLVIRLSMKIRPSAFSMEHIPKTLSPTGQISSAPRQFTVYGLDDESQQGGKLLGNYIYAEDGDALQTYPVSEENVDPYQIIEIRVLSNWGHQEYTCLYRVRVHGHPV